MKRPTRILRTAGTLRCITALLLAFDLIAQAQDKAPGPAAADAPAPVAISAPMEMQKWIATTDAQWQAAFKRDVSDVRETELGKLKLQYLTSLEAALERVMHFSLKKSCTL